MIAERNEMELKITRIQGELEMYKREAKAARRKRRKAHQKATTSESAGSSSDESEDSFATRQARHNPP